METANTARREGYLRENFRYFHLRDTEGQERDYHFHEFDKLVILLSGHVEYEIETSVYPLRPWDVLLVRHHAIHKANIDVSEPYERVILYIDGKYIDRTVPEARLMACFDRADVLGRHCLSPSPGDRGRLARLLEELEGETRAGGFGSEPLQSALLIQLLVWINRLEPEADPPAAPRRTQHDDKIGQVLSYINENLDRELTVEQLAARAYLSRYHFMRLFKARTGSSVHSYIRQRRLLNAAKRIRGGEPAGTVAADCGYADYSSFYRAFRDCFGASPSDIK